jgi:hypothetical protein
VRDRLCTKDHNETKRVFWIHRKKHLEIGQTDGHQENGEAYHNRIELQGSHKRKTSSRDYLVVDTRSVVPMLLLWTSWKCEKRLKRKFFFYQVIQHAGIKAILTLYGLRDSDEACDSHHSRRRLLTPNNQ